jgi:hypothetical protein
MDSLGGFKVGDTVRCIHRTQPPDASDGAETWWQPSKEGHVGKIERIVRMGDDPFGPRWDYLVVGGNFYRPHWLEKVSVGSFKVGDRVTFVNASDASLFDKPGLFDPHTLFTTQSMFDSIFKKSWPKPMFDLGPGLYTTQPARTVMPKESEHDELLRLRVEVKHERMWGDHWKSIANAKDDHFKRATEAEVACAAATDTLEEQDQEISALKTENRALKVCRDDWMKDAAESRREKLEAQAGWGRAAVERDRALRVRNMSLAGLLVGAAGVVYQALLTTGVL